MPEPVMLALGVAIGRLLLRWADLNDTADAVEDARTGLSALKVLGSKKAAGPLSQAITDLLDQHLAGAKDQCRRDEMRIAVKNVADLFDGLADDDIRKAAQDPAGFPRYLLQGPGQRLLLATEEALTSFTEELMTVGAKVFAELAPRSSRFTAAALVRLLGQVDAATHGLAGLREEIVALKGELDPVAVRIDGRIEALHPKVDRLIELSDRSGWVTADVASLRATERGSLIDRSLDDWSASDLGVHASIAVDDAPVLTPYLKRAHDEELFDALKSLDAPAAPSKFVLLVGTSCTGKTRALYEAVLGAAPDRRVTMPRTDSDLAQLLISGVPSGTIVWLDEIQDRLTLTPDGITAAKCMNQILNSDRGVSVLFAGTIWPQNYSAMLRRPSPESAEIGAAVTRDLISAAHVVHVPEAFTDSDLVAAGNIEDRRLRVAIATAARTDGPARGRKVIQVLAGGMQLVKRLYPQLGKYQDGEFSPAAKAVLRAAADLRRVGMPNPLPAWAVEGAALGYLDSGGGRPLAQWLPRALAEATHSASLDDSVTRTHVLDIHAEGVPALSPRWTTGSDDTPALGFDLHDYLLEDHVTRHSRTPTSRALWDALTSNTALLPYQTLAILAQNAAGRGLTSTAIALTRAILVNETMGGELMRLLASLGTPEALAELSAIVDASGHGAGIALLAECLAERARYGDSAALSELRARARSVHAGAELFDEPGSTESEFAWAEEGIAWSNLCRALANRALDGDGEALSELEMVAKEGDMIAAINLSMMKGLANARSLPQLSSRATSPTDADSLNSLRDGVHQAFEDDARRLLSVYRRQSPTRWVKELDVEARPVFDALPSG